MKKYKGVLNFFSETGTEGGYWAFQDEQFMGIPDDTESCAICGVFRNYFERYGNPTRTEDELKFGFREPCKKHTWKKAYPNGKWSYEGLHILKNNDWLIIYDKDRADEVVWEGRIELFRHLLQEEEVFGWYIHSDQRGMNREEWAKWFFEEYPAVLMAAD